MDNSKDGLKPVTCVICSEQRWGTIDEPDYTVCARQECRNEAAALLATFRETESNNHADRVCPYCVNGIVYTGVSGFTLTCKHCKGTARLLASADGMQGEGGG